MESLPLILTCSMPYKIDIWSVVVHYRCRRQADKGSYDLGHHAAIQFEVTFAIPVKIHIELDALGFSLVNINVGHSEGRWPKVKLDKA